LAICHFAFGESFSFLHKLDAEIERVPTGGLSGIASNGMSPKTWANVVSRLRWPLRPARRLFAYPWEIWQSHGSARFPAARAKPDDRFDRYFRAREIAELTGLSLRTVRRRIADETLRSPTSLVEIGDSPLQIWRDCNVARQYRARHAVSMSVRRADAPVVPISASCSSSVTR
jgi:hypothetical protein